MASNIGSLIVELSVNTASFETDLGRAARAADKSAREIQRKWDTLGKTIGTVAIAAGTAITAMALKAIEAGDNLAKAASKSGIAVKAFSELAYAAQLSDVDLTSLSTALKKMQVALSTAGTGSKEAIRALDALGLKLSQIAGLSPDRQFELLADRINKLKDPADRTRAAVEFFGKAGADLLPAFEGGAAGIRALRSEAERLGKTLDEKGAKQIQEADAALKRMKASGEGLAQTLAIKLSPAIASVADSLRILFGGGTEEDTLKQLRKIRETILSGIGGDLSKLPSGGQELKYLKELNAQIDELEHKARLRRNPVTHNRGATLISAEPPGFQSADAAIKAQEELEKQNKKLAESFSDMYGTLTKEVANLTEKSAEAFGRRLDANMDALDAEEKREREHAEFIKDYYKQLDNETQTVLEKQTAAVKEFQEKIDILVASGMSPEEGKKRLEEFKRTFDTLSVYAEEAARNMQDAFADFLFDPFSDGLKGMLKSFIDILRRMIAEAAAAKVFETLFGKNGSGGKATNILGSIFGAIFGGARASGGPVNTGKAYLVGERGPELFSPSTAGNIVPTQSIGRTGGVTINNNVDARGATADAIALLPEVLRRNNEQLEAKIIQGLQRRRYDLG